MEVILQITLQIIKYSIVICTYLGLALGKLPLLRMNRATIALVGAAFLVALNVLTLTEAWDAIDADRFSFNLIWLCG